ncbi:MAG: 30S ribosomal protein S8 [Candidatus Aenigmarchaeota archaeon]|nr:30S ribosomal protein S8 [Candidatus Aenigmarchaeota archaeon]
MMRHDMLADVMSKINNAEREGKSYCIVPSSKMIKNVLNVMQKNSYIGKMHEEKDVRGNRIKIELLGRVNCSKVIRPRFAVKASEFEKWEIRYLPAKGFGILIFSTSKGVMSQKDTLEKNIGGRLLAFVY